MRTLRKTLWTAILLAGVVAVPLTTPASADQVILDDLVVDGSVCAGLDCVNGESFGFDTIRLKENNLRIKFQDTSTTASFPKNDWQLTANDSSNGGQEKFSIDDIDGGRTPFTIEAGAPSHSLYVDDGGRIGFGTSTPVATLHAKDGDTPTLRLEQDGSQGFTPQTWDLAGNETNFFIRDATNGSKLPFRIRPGAPTSAIDVAADGSIGLGTSSPAANLHLNYAGTVLTVLQSTDNGAVQLRLKSDDNNRRLVAKDGSDNNQSQIVFEDDGAFQFLGPTGGDVRATIASNGDFTAEGTVFANGGTDSLPDYVFDPDYALMPIGEVAEFVAREKHLPNVPSADEVAAEGRIDIVKMQLKLLEKVEELTLYTIAQENQIREQSARIRELEAVTKKEVAAQE